jgi:hypothetical protein
VSRCLGLAPAVAPSGSIHIEHPGRAEAEYRLRGIHQLIEDFEAATSWAAGDSKLARELRLQQRLLDSERQHPSTEGAQAGRPRAESFPAVTSSSIGDVTARACEGYLNAGLQTSSVMVAFRTSSALEDPLRVRTLQSQSVGLTSLAVTGYGKRLITAVGPMATIWDVPTGQILRSWKADKSPLQDVAIALDGKRDLSAGLGKKLTYQDIESGEKVWSRQPNLYDIEFIALTANGSMAVTCSLGPADDMLGYALRARKSAAEGPQERSCGGSEKLRWPVRDLRRYRCKSGFLGSRNEIVHLQIPHQLQERQHPARHNRLWIGR